MKAGGPDREKVSALSVLYEDASLMFSGAMNSFLLWGQRCPHIPPNPCDTNWLDEDYRRRELSGWAAQIGQDL